MIYAVAALLLFQLLGECIVQVLALPLPGALVGMLLLFAGLMWRGRAPEALARTGGTLLQHLMLLLVPSVAGVMMHFGRVAREWQPFLIACVVGAAVTLVVTALTFQWMLKLRAKAGR